MKYKYRLERVFLNGVREATERLTALGGQGWHVVESVHHGNELFVLMELVQHGNELFVPMVLPIDKTDQTPATEPKRGPGRPPKNVSTSVTSSVEGIEITVS